MYQFSWQQGEESDWRDVAEVRVALFVPRAAVRITPNGLEQPTHTIPTKRFVPTGRWCASQQKPDENHQKACVGWLHLYPRSILQSSNGNGERPVIRGLEEVRCRLLDHLSAWRGGRRGGRNVHACLVPLEHVRRTNTKRPLLASDEETAHSSLSRDFRAIEVQDDVRD